MTSWRKIRISMSLAAVLRASNPSQPNTVTEIKYSSLNSTALDHGPITGTRETPGHRLCDEFWHGTGSQRAGLPHSQPPSYAAQQRPVTQTVLRLHHRGHVTGI
jgi:hypothetical protein